MDLIIIEQKLDSKIRKLEQTLEQKYVRLEQFIHTYLQFQMIFDEIGLTTEDAVFYLESLKSELNMLSVHHLSTNTISPKGLKELLTEVKLPLVYEWSLNHDVTFALLFLSPVHSYKLPMHLAKCQAVPKYFQF